MNGKSILINATVVRKAHILNTLIIVQRTKLIILTVSATVMSALRNMHQDF